MMYKTTHEAEALGLLIEQFKDKENMRTLLSAWVSQLQQIETAVFEIVQAFNVADAAGDMLDNIGKIVGELRNGRDDDTYRIHIKVRIRLNVSSGTIPDLAGIFRLLEPTSEIVVREGFPASLVLEILDAITPAEAAEYGKVMQSAKPAGVGASVIYALAPPGAAFTFSTDATAASDAARGFSDTSQIAGGTLAGVA